MVCIHNPVVTFNIRTIERITAVCVKPFGFDGIAEDGGVLLSFMNGANPARAYLSRDSLFELATGTAVRVEMMSDVIGQNDIRESMAIDACLSKLTVEHQELLTITPGSAGILESILERFRDDHL